MLVFDCLMEIKFQDKQWESKQQKMWNLLEVPGVRKIVVGNDDGHVAFTLLLVKWKLSFFAIDDV